jgi:hypothetical protein
LVDPGMVFNNPAFWTTIKKYPSLGNIKVAEFVILDVVELTEYQSSPYLIPPLIDPTQI